jgi:hypothetical protein
MTANGTKLFLATFKEGVLVSSDDGVNWETASEQMAARRIDAIHAHDGSLFAGAYGDGSYRSMDEGLTWARLGGPMDGMVAYCFLSIGTQLFAGCNNGGVYRSTDKGDTWVAIHDGLPAETVYALSTHDGMLLAGLNYHAVWKRPLSEVLLDVEDGTSFPHAFRLHPVSPQPLRDRGTVRFDLEVGADVRLELFDLLGRQVATATAARFEAGSHTVAFDVSGLRTGSYLLRLQAGGEQAMQRVTVIR